MSVIPPIKRLAASWVDNADAWTTAVRSGGIPSRRAGTDEAILKAIAQAPTGPLIDVGCGEGWLARAIASQGREVVGIDASAPLIDAAKGAGSADGPLAGPPTGPRYEQVSYAELAARATELGAPFAVAVCNFALLDDRLSEALGAIRAVLVPTGVLLIQTVHPFTACGDGSYTNGWREETFDAFGGRFPSAMPWYFRTLGSWITELHDSGFVLESVTEPPSPAGPLPLSLLLAARRTL